MENIVNTFVTVAADSTTQQAVVPLAKGTTTPVHVIQYELLTTQPYTLTFAELIYETHLRRLGLTKAPTKQQADEIRAELFSKSHACLRASALTKKYGWGVHHDAAGKIALYSMESPEYQRFAAGKDPAVKVVAAMRTKRA